MSIYTFTPGQRLQFDYLNHRDVLEHRDVVFKGLDYGVNEWYHEAQWFMRCYDPSRKGDRSFALERMDGTMIRTVFDGLTEIAERLA
jgi:predicted DNA-binding transcriptional regulator YafY